MGKGSYGVDVDDTGETVNHVLGKALGDDSRVIASLLVILKCDDGFVFGMENL